MPSTMSLEMIFGCSVTWFPLIAFPRLSGSPAFCGGVYSRGEGKLQSPSLIPPSWGCVFIHWNPGLQPSTRGSCWRIQVGWGPGTSQGKTRTVLRGLGGEVLMASVRPPPGGGVLPRCLQLQHGRECGVTEACLTPWPGDKHLEIQAGRRPLHQARPCDPKDQAEQHLPAPQRIHSQPASPPHAIGSHFSLGPGTLVTLQHLSSLLFGHTQCTAVSCPSVASWGPEGSARAAASRARHTPDGFTSKNLPSHGPGGWMAAGLPPSEG